MSRPAGRLPAGDPSPLASPAGAAGPLARSGSLRSAPPVSGCRAVNVQLNCQAAGDAQEDRQWGLRPPGAYGLPKRPGPATTQSRASPAPVPRATGRRRGRVLPPAVRGSQHEGPWTGRRRRAKPRTDPRLEGHRALTGPARQRGRANVLTSRRARRPAGPLSQPTPSPESDAGQVAGQARPHGGHRR